MSILGISLEVTEVPSVSPLRPFYKGIINMRTIYNEIMFYVAWFFTGVSVVATLFALAGVIVRRVFQIDFCIFGN